MITTEILFFRNFLIHYFCIFLCPENRLLCLFFCTKRTLFFCVYILLSVHFNESELVHTVGEWLDSFLHSKLLALLNALSDSTWLLVKPSHTMQALASIPVKTPKSSWGLHFWDLPDQPWTWCSQQFCGSGAAFKFCL